MTRKPAKQKKVAFCLIIFLLHASVFANADLVIINADIRTMDAQKPRAEAVAVVKNRISAVGTSQQIRSLIGKNTKVIDAGGKLVLPGFNDAHVHFMAMGGQFFSVDLRDAKTSQEALEKIKFHVRFLPPGQWILGGGWNSENWTPSALPMKDLIDAATPSHPVLLYDSTGKTALVNSLALKLARIDKNTSSESVSEILRDAAGNPTGILKGSAINSVKKLISLPATANKASVAETASNYAAAFGVTSVQDVSSDENTEIYRELLRQGKLKTRIYDCAALSDWKKLAQKNIKRADGDAMIRRGCLKGSAEGDAELTNALYEEISAADRAGLQVAVHAIGAQANEQILSIFERTIRANGKKDRRFRVEHAHRFRAADLRRYADSGIIASVQPYLFSDGAGKSFDPLRNLLKSKTTLAFGSDSSMIEINPLLGIAAAVNTSEPRQKLSVQEAVRFYTLGSAFAEFQETEKGSIAVGKLADFVMLSQDIFAVSPQEIFKTRVLTTVVDGHVVFEAK